MTGPRLALACLAGIAFSAAWYGPALASSTAIGVNDFLNFYTAGKLAGSGQLYHPATFISTEARVTGYSTENLIFVRLPWQAALFWPLAQLPYIPAYWLWQTLCLTALLAAIAIWPLQTLQTKLLAAAWSFPLFTSLAVAQDVPFLLLAIAVAFRYRATRPLLTGVALALCAAKVHLLWLFVLLFLDWRNKRQLTGFFGCGAILIALCFLAGTPNWIPQFLAALKFCEGHEAVALMPNLHRIFLFNPPLELASALACIGAVFYIATRNRILGAATALSAGILTGRHDFIADTSLLLPAIGLIATQIPEARKPLLILLPPFAYLLIFLGRPLAPTLLFLALIGGVAWHCARQQIARARI